MRKEIKDNLRTLFAVAFCVILFGYFGTSPDYLGWVIGTILGALALADFDVWILKSDKNSESIPKEKVWGFFLYISLFIIAIDFALKLTNIAPHGFLLGVFLGFILYTVFRPRNLDPISLLYKEIGRRVFPSKS
ncbi:MAG: hypothetical protein CVV22_00240 [Ignavibacteriae bacterium HGW-Ignavibacteriae-1]|jgi:hypothetical protein|nr:MAG: hypothetical protein CVV22_00240 [Ignavibacteriae bacterium HGW-Ignavibacteriae-1]